MPPETIAFANYVVGFVDILGQRSEFAGESLLPRQPDGSIPDSFVQKARRTIGVIRDMHQACEFHLQGQRSLSQSTRDALPAEQRPVYDRLRSTSLRCQRWSDGLVYFQTLSDRVDDVPMNGICGLTSVLGALCFLNLARKSPIRGGVDIGWGVELWPGEIYGAAVARAYECESVNAKWPRIVVSEDTLNFLDAAASAPVDSVFNALNQKLASVVRSWIERDVDGQYHLHYLGYAFRQSAGNPRHDEIVPQISSFIQEQIDHWRRMNNPKLLERYEILKDYYDRNRHPLPIDTQP
jgi:hypothetical protein